MTNEEIMAEALRDIAKTEEGLVFGLLARKNRNALDDFKQICAALEKCGNIARGTLSRLKVAEIGKEGE